LTLPLELVGANLIETCVNASSRQQLVTIIPISDARCTSSSLTAPVRRLSFDPSLLRQPHDMRVRRDLGQLANSELGQLVNFLQVLQGIQPPQGQAQSDLHTSRQ
jgi:hypothetical protein